MYYLVETTSNSQIYMAIVELEDKVRELIKDGWKLQGGICITYVQHSNLFFASQALGM